MDCQDAGARWRTAAALGMRVADELLARGAASIIAQQRTPTSAELP